MKKILLTATLLLAASASAVCEAADVTGRAVFTGERPVVQRLKTGSDPHCQGTHPDGIASEEAIIAADGGLKNVFVYVKSGVSGSFDPPTEAVVLDQNGCRYEPHVIGLRTRQKLDILNSDDTLHNVHTQARVNRPFNIGMPIKNMRLTKTFDKPEIMVKFKCDVHPWMAAYAGVVDHPFFAVTDASGAFKIAGLPAGEYEIEAWHEKFGARSAKMTVTAEDAEKTTVFEFGANAS